MSEAARRQRLQSRDVVIERARETIRRLPEHHRAALQYEYDRAEMEARRMANRSPLGSARDDDD